MSASDHRGIARENLSGKWKISVGAAFVAAIFGALLTNAGSLNIEIDEEAMRKLPEIAIIYLKAILTTGSTISLLQFILGGTVQLGYTKFLLKQYDKEDPEIKELFSQFDRFGQGFAQFLLRSLYTLLWALLFIIPGIVKSYSYAMTPFIMIDHPDMTAKEAIEASKVMMDGHKADLFLLDLSFIGWSLLNILTLGIGSLFLNPYMNAARTSFYRSLTDRRTHIE